MRDHGGDLDRAVQEFGAGGWLDLSTGINASPYPLPELSARSWGSLPTKADIAALCDAARRAYGTPGDIVPVAGAQAAIQLVPRLRQPGRARVLGPTYNEHAASLTAQGWQVETVATLDDCRGADVVVVVNPNNPDGNCCDAAELLSLRSENSLLIVDESFADSEPGLSIAPQIAAEEDRIVVLRSFGKFYGLAGLRLGFSLTGNVLADRMRAFAGPWSVSGPAIEIGRVALADTAWQSATRVRLAQDARRLDALAKRAGWSLVGGTSLFRTYETESAHAAQRKLAAAHVWSRIFPYSDSWIRLGLPGDDAGWAQLESAL